MKTASFSQRKCLSVITRQDKKVSARQWTERDIANGWECGRLNSANAAKLMDEGWSGLRLSRSGTLIVWDDIDRMEPRLDDIHGYGFTAWRKLLPELKAKQITSSPHAWGSGLNTIYIGHLGAGLGNVLTVEGVTCSQKDVDFGENRIRHGLLELSSKPGFGLQLRGP